MLLVASGFCPKFARVCVSSSISPPSDSACCGAHTIALRIARSHRFSLSRNPSGATSTHPSRSSDHPVSPSAPSMRGSTPPAPPLPEAALAEERKSDALEAHAPRSFAAAGEASRDDSGEKRVGEERADDEKGAAGRDADAAKDVTRPQAAVDALEAAGTARSAGSASRGASKIWRQACTVSSTARSSCSSRCRCRTSGAPGPPYRPSAVTPPAGRLTPSRPPSIAARAPRAPPAGTCLGQKGSFKS